MFHKVVQQHMQGAVGWWDQFNCKFTKESSIGKKSVNRLRFDRITVMTL